MLFFILFTATLNVGFGFGLAIAIRRMIPEPSSSLVVEPADTFLPDLNSLSSVSADNEETISPDRDSLDKGTAVPAEYLLTLTEESIEAESLVEAAAQILRLEIGKYCLRLLEIENRLRDLWYHPTEDALQELCDDLEDLNLSWLESQETASDHLSDSHNDLGDYAEVAARLNEVLLGQTVQIESTLNNLRQLDLTLDLGDACRKLVMNISRLTDLGHDLRDKMQETVIAILRSEQRLGSLATHMKEDRLTGLANRTGIESILYQWWHEARRCDQLASVALIDIDHFRKLNVRLGTDVCDKALAAFAKFVTESISRDRGYKVVSRFSGQQLLLFFGDTGPREATSTVERIRQTLRQTTFTTEGIEFDLAISAGVTEVQPTDTAPKLFTRVQTALRAAKKNGRNLTVLDEGTGPRLITPPEYRVRGRVVKLAE